MSSASISFRIARHPLRVPLQRLERAHPHHRDVVALESVARQQLPHLQLHQVQQLRVVHRIHLVQRHHQVRHVHLPRQQHVLPRLRHRPVGRTHHQDRPVHLRRARDHVLDVVGVPRAVHVRVVPVRRRIFHVARRNRQNLRVVPPPLRLRRLRHLVIRHELRPPLVRRHLRQGRRQRRLPVIDVPDRPHVHVRFRTIKFLFRHRDSLRYVGPGSSPAPTLTCRGRPSGRPTPISCPVYGPQPLRLRSGAPVRIDRSASNRWRAPACASADPSHSRTSLKAARGP